MRYYAHVVQADGTSDANEQVGPTFCPEFEYKTYPASMQPCELKRVESYPITPDGFGHALVPVMLDKPRMLIVDTGGARSTLYESTVREMGLSPDDAKDVGRKSHYSSGDIVSFSGKVLDKVVTAPLLSLGVLQFQNPTFSVEAGSAPVSAGFSQAEGSLGPSHLMTFDVELDFGSKTLNLYLQHHCWDHVVYWAKDYAVVPFTISPEGHIEFTIALDGKPLKAVLDTGAPISSIDGKVAHDVFGISLPAETTPAQAAPSAEAVQMLGYHRFTKMTFGKAQFDAPDFAITPDLMGSQSNTAAPQAILGLREISAFHIFIAWTERRMYVTLAGAH